MKRASIRHLTVPPASCMRYLQTLLELGADQNPTVVFPLPMDVIGPLMGAPKGEAGRALSPRIASRSGRFVVVRNHRNIPQVRVSARIFLAGSRENAKRSPRRKPGKEGVWPAAGLMRWLRRAKLFESATYRRGAGAAGTSASG